MADFQFTATSAQRGNIRLRLGLCGAGGSGKSYSAMAIASAFALRLNLGALYVIDSENGSALRYAKSAKTGRGFDFYHVPMPIDDYSPGSYCAALDFCESKGARVILVDSISHEWDGPRGIQEIVDNNTQGRDGFSGWRVATPLHKRFLQRLNTVDAHLIWTVRAKTAYTSRKENGKMKFEKEGLGPVQREGIEYEPDVFGWMADSTLTLDKTRCDRTEPGMTFVRPGDDVAELLADWIQDVGAPSALPSVEPNIASPDANERAKAYRAALARAGSVEIVDALRAGIDLAEKVPKLRTDAIMWCDVRRVALTPGDTAGAAS